MADSFHHRLSHSILLLLDIFRYFPLRIVRIFRHLASLGTYVNKPVLYGVRLGVPGRILLWLGELILLFLDVLGTPEWYEIINCWFKYHSRPLKEQELLQARAIFGNTLPYRRIRLDERAYLGPRQYRFCYVSFCVINSWQEMPPAILIHELVHVWQFRQFGSPYLLRALLAQRTAAGYDYGGIPDLLRAKEQDLGLSPFNYEQQASIIEDFFLLQQSGRARWIPAGMELPMETFRYFVDALNITQCRV